MKFECSIHGELKPSERIMWSKNSSTQRWCKYCTNDMMDKHCGKLIITEDDKKEDKK